MRKVIYALSVSLDGFIEAANGDLSWGNPDEEFFKHVIDRERLIDVYLHGRRLYENMAAYWPAADQNPSATKLDLEYAPIWRNKPKIVFSRTLDRVGWNSQLVSGDLIGVVNRLKEQTGGYLEVAGAGLAASFMQRGLIDEYWLYVHPIILGGGKPMFPPLQERINVRLIELCRFGSGMVLLRYER